METEKLKALRIKERLTYSIYKGVWTGLDFLFPPACGGCGKYGIRWCRECDQKVERISSEICPICGQKQQTKTICSRCKSNRPIYNQLRSWAVFNNEIRNAIHKLKYRNDISLGETLSRPLINLLYDLPWEIEIVIPIPLSHQRLKERGYNQAALIALPIALGLGLRYHPKALKRIRETESQVGLTIKERHENVSGAFAAYHGIVSGKTILLVDDVATSGATLNACADALLLAQAKEVNAITLARAMYN